MQISNAENHTFQLQPVSITIFGFKFYAHDFNFKKFNRYIRLMTHIYNSWCATLDADGSS